MYNDEDLVAKMVRNYCRKTQQGSWHKENLQGAIMAVLKGELGYMKASKIFSIPKTTLIRYVKKHKNFMMITFRLVIYTMATRESKKPKKKHVTLSVIQKLELIKKLEAGASVTSICVQYGIKKQTVSGIRKAKDKLTTFSLKYNVAANSKLSVGARKRMRVAKDTNLEEAVTKWFIHQRSCGNNIRGVEIQSAAVKLARDMGIDNFVASDGWLWRFRNRHGMCNKITTGEAGSPSTGELTV
ncbi:transposable element-derived 7-like 10 [Octopus vulgaris]|uniref:Transposable element-derived 7-like 10 n=1 Tax=Octopus vulgaris TaxID=6645 RepID=A0AA36APX4_OCTVU|nr:transposable element-derived 7-like 10 [Octopus vulgaris]